MHPLHEEAKEEEGRNRFSEMSRSVKLSMENIPSSSEAGAVVHVTNAVKNGRERQKSRRRENKKQTGKTKKKVSACKRDEAEEEPNRESEKERYVKQGEINK